MPTEIFIALVLFATVSTISPGPNNVMLMSSGANFGFLKTIPHMLGIAVGFSFMVILVGAGVMVLFDLMPVSYQILKVVSVLYLLFLAFKILTSKGAVDPNQLSSKPFSFIQAALFQWVNPKAWSMAVTAISVYAPSRNLTSVALVALVFGLVNIPSVSTWAALGQSLQVWLTNPVRLRVFNTSMAGLLVFSLYPALV